MTATEPKDADVEMVYYADGGIELRDGEGTERWISSDEPVEVRQ